MLLLNYQQKWQRYSAEQLSRTRITSSAVFEWDIRHRTAVHWDINVVTLKSSRFSDIPLLIIGIKPAPDDFPPQLRAALRLSAVRWRDLPPSRSRTQSARCRSYFYIIADTSVIHITYPYPMTMKFIEASKPNSHAFDSIKQKHNILQQIRLCVY